MRLRKQNKRIHILISKTPKRLSPWLVLLAINIVLVIAYFSMQSMTLSTSSFGSSYDKTQSTLATMNDLADALSVPVGTCETLECKAKTFATERNLNQLRKQAPLEPEYVPCDLSQLRTDLQTLVLPEHHCPWIHSTSRAEMLRWLFGNPNPKKLLKKSSSSGLKWIAMLGDSILRHQLFYLTDFLIRPDKIKRQLPTPTGVWLNKSIHDYKAFKQSGLVHTRLVCCAVTASHHVKLLTKALKDEPVSIERLCRWKHVHMRTGRELGKVHPSERPLRQDVQSFRHLMRKKVNFESEPQGFCFSWQYLNFPDHDMIEEIKGHLAPKPNEFKPTAMIVDGGLHSLMRNQTLSQFLSEYEQLLHRSLISLPPRSDSHLEIQTIRFIFHDITMTKIKELPPWKQHITDSKIRKWNAEIWRMFQNVGCVPLGSSYQMHLLKSSRYRPSLNQLHHHTWLHRQVCRLLPQADEQEGLIYLPVSHLTEWFGENAFRHEVQAEKTLKMGASQKEFKVIVPVDTIGDGMHLNEAFNHIVSQLDFNLLMMDSKKE